MNDAHPPSRIVRHRQGADVARAVRGTPDLGDDPAGQAMGGICHRLLGEATAGRLGFDGDSVVRLAPLPSQRKASEEGGGPQ